MRISGMKKCAVLVLTVLLAALMLAGCSSKQCISCGKSFRSGGYKTAMGYVCDDCYQLSGAVVSSASSGVSTGAWVAIVVMVFVVVLAATSGVVYVVLRQKLEQQKPAPRHSQPQPSIRRSEPPRMAPRQSPPVSAQQGGIWICPNDRSRNTGRFCVACGAPRPTVTPPRAAGTEALPRTNPARPANPAVQSQPNFPAQNRPQTSPAASKPGNPIFDFDEAVVQPVRNPAKAGSATRPQPVVAPAKIPAKPPANPQEAQNALQGRISSVIPAQPAAPEKTTAPAVPVPPVQPQKNAPVPEEHVAPVTSPPAGSVKKGFHTAYVRPAESEGQEETDLISEILKSGEQ